MSNFDPAAFAAEEDDFDPAAFAAGDAPPRPSDDHLDFDTGLPLVAPPKAPAAPAKENPLAKQQRDWESFFDGADDLLGKPALYAAGAGAEIKPVASLVGAGIDKLSGDERPFNDLAVDAGKSWDSFYKPVTDHPIRSLPAMIGGGIPGLMVGGASFAAKKIAPAIGNFLLGIGHGGLAGYGQRGDAGEAVDGAALGGALSLAPGVSGAAWGGGRDLASKALQLPAQAMRSAKVRPGPWTGIPEFVGKKISRAPQGNPFAGDFPGFPASDPPTVPPTAWESFAGDLTTGGVKVPPKPARVPIPVPRRDLVPPRPDPRSEFQSFDGDLTTGGVKAAPPAPSPAPSPAKPAPQTAADLQREIDQLEQFATFDEVRRSTTPVLEKSALTKPLRPTPPEPSPVKPPEPPEPAPYELIDDLGDHSQVVPAPTPHRFKSKGDAFAKLKAAGGIDDYDGSRQDQAYEAWKRQQAERARQRISMPKAAAELDEHGNPIAQKRKRGPALLRKPPPFEGGHYDEINTLLNLEGNQRVSGGREAFDKLSGNARTWEDLESAISKLRRVPGLKSLRLPDDVQASMLPPDEASGSFNFGANVKAPAPPPERAPPIRFEPVTPRQAAERQAVAANPDLDTQVTGPASGALAWARREKVAYQNNAAGIARPRRTRSELHPSDRRDPDWSDYADWDNAKASGASFRDLKKAREQQLVDDVNTAWLPGEENWDLWGRSPDTVARSVAKEPAKPSWLEGLDPIPKQTFKRSAGK